MAEKAYMTGTAGDTNRDTEGSAGEGSGGYQEAVTRNQREEAPCHMGRE